MRNAEGAPPPVRQ